ncbi:prepilin-type N-terminal cleavage/methylation domain-containing protein [bacterium]|jgi:prepilin-type N-terminal cleavage/methylation domain-containing protein|nr:prepilin-type N-terminal cleavage/methylation domain-containing protein [bacterium]MBT4649432.1 prepilin-type N-terminal cleavage/methylation domain-containing protein [bacterium]
MNKKGFTLIELIIVIAVIALLAAAVFVAVDPAKRIGQARDAQRWSDVTSVADGIMKYIVDESGSFPTSTATFTSNGATYYAIMGYGTTGAAGTTCQNQTVGAVGISLDNIVTTYLPTMPIDPGSVAYGTVSTGYYFMRTDSGRIQIGACVESDYADASIYVQR